MRVEERPHGSVMVLVEEHELEQFEMALRECGDAVTAGTSIAALPNLEIL
jgi:hypothetical protein